MRVRNETSQPKKDQEIIKIRRPGRSRSLERLVGGRTLPPLLTLLCKPYIRRISARMFYLVHVNDSFIVLPSAARIRNNPLMPSIGFGGLIPT